MSNNRFKHFHTTAGTVIVDRKRKAWYLVSGKRILDYGKTRELPGFLTYLPGRREER